jgi:hypothetical protein
LKVSRPTASELASDTYRILTVFVLALLLPGCASAIVTQSGRLSSYKELKSSEGMATKGKVHIDGQVVSLGKDRSAHIYNGGHASFGGGSDFQAIAAG